MSEQNLNDQQAVFVHELSDEDLAAIESAECTDAYIASIGYSVPDEALIKMSSSGKSLMHTAETDVVLLFAGTAGDCDAKINVNGVLNDLTLGDRINLPAGSRFQLVVSGGLSGQQCNLGLVQL